MTLKFGLIVPQGWRMDLVGIADPVEAYETMTRVAQVAEEVGFDSIWLFDHFHTVPRPTQEVTFECWTSTAALARDTKRVRIGQMVTCNGYRNPALLAKMASTVDVLSHGRLDFGIGAGWYEHEYRAYGYDFPDAPTRLRYLREAVQIIRKMWSDDETVFEGKYYQVRGAINQPKGVQKPHIPLLIGGGGEQVTLKLVAQGGSLPAQYPFRAFPRTGTGGDARSHSPASTRDRASRSAGGHHLSLRRGPTGFGTPLCQRMHAKIDMEAKRDV
jgi:F420-dependent oxidoreductase-like protein